MTRVTQSWSRRGGLTKAFGTRLLRRLLPVVDIILLPFVYPSALVVKLVRVAGVERLPCCRSALLKIGVFPIRDHYHEPQFDNRSPRISFAHDRTLPGIDWNVPEQLQILSQYSFAHELRDLPRKKGQPLEFYLDNGSFESGDAEYWYQLVRSRKPRRIIEVGGGNSTLLAIKAIRKNQQEDPNYRCKHVCIEPFEMPWLEETGVSVVRKKVEEVAVSFFSELEADDVLFIDSSHIIRPQGDVLFEYLELLPTLNKGVIVHTHDIFSPKNYPEQWLAEKVLFWNEQYLLEAFLSHNSSWKIVGAVNFLHHKYYDRLKSVAPFLTPGREPGSFYIQKVA